MSRIMQTLASKKDEGTFPQNMLTRFHFLELIVRMTMSKYTKQNDAYRPHDCVRRFI